MGGTPHWPGLPSKSDIVILPGRPVNPPQLQWEETAGSSLVTGPSVWAGLSVVMI